MNLAETYRRDAWHMRWSFYISFVMLAIGGFYGTLQALDKMGVDLYRYLPDPLYRYYLGLTVHGVTLGWMFTVFFIIAFLNLVTIHGLRRPLESPGLAKVTFSLAVLGAAVALIPTFTNEASVLWTFYAPLQAHPAFYIGLTAIVVATWTAGLNAYLTWRSWKREHPEERTPLMSFAALTTWAMWALASVGVAASMLFQLIPWSSGLLAQVNPLLNRSLFWFTGHPVVYFWLLPAYISWYTMLPAQVGGRLFSESLARLVFLSFIPFAIPTGLHHMFPDPGIPHSTKLLHAILTFAVVFPSLVTAFTVVASVEEGARRNGGTGRFRWILRLPWLTNPAVSGQLLGMVLFATGGITGIINASYGMNLVVHNTMWIPGHLHTQVAGAVTLTWMAASFWLIPLLTGKKLWSVRLSTLQVWTWFFGMAIMARGMHWMGMAGVPRRVHLTYAPYALFDEWRLAGWLVGAGGVLLFLSGALFLYVIAMTVWFSRSPAQVEVPEAKPLHPVERMPLVLDRITPWATVTVVLIAIAWLPSIYRIATTHPYVQGWRLW
ncbi:MAG TPA: cbb3-type cytochrome c oxidase subunit I [Limnochordia bacterium]|nr:cbb3-type cytochrome c oxidase subunit I [Limnochordia bacterium]